MSQKFQILSQLWNKDWTLKAFIPAAICLLDMFIFHTPLCGMLFFVLIFTILDIIGFVNLSARDNQNDGMNTPRIAYRIVQTTLQVLLCCLVVSLCGFWAMLGGMVAWWFGVCDYLFYVLQNDHNDYTPYPWLNWSAAGILSKMGTIT